MNKARRFIIILFPIVLVTYFFATFVPNVVSWDSALEAFFTSGVTKLIWRAAFALLYTVYVVFAFFVLKPSINKKLVVISLIAFSVLLLSPIFNLSDISFTYVDDFQEIVNTTIKIGMFELLVFYTDALFSLVFFLSLFLVLPTLMKESKGYILLFYLFAGFMLLSCILSYVLEADAYRLIIQNNTNAQLSGIRSIYPSKNAFGAFLVQGIIISAFMLFRSLNDAEHKKRFVNIVTTLSWSLLASIFLITLFFSFNKNGIGAALVFIVSVIIFFLYRFITKQRKPLSKKIRIAGLFLLAITVITVAFILINPTTSLAFMRALEGRGDLVISFFNNFQGYNIFLGFGHSFPFHVNSWSLIGDFVSIVSDVHNAYLSALGMGGILFLAFYVGLHFYAFRIIDQRKNNLMVYVVPSAALLAYSFWAFFESAQIFISGSSASSLMSLLIVAIPMATVVIRREEVIHLETDIA